MRARLQLLISELRRLKREGVEALPVSDEALELLRRKASASAGAGRSPGAAPERGKGVAPAEQQSGPVVRDEPTPAPKAQLPDPPVIELPAGDKAERWAHLRKRVLSDPECCRHVRPGCRVVFGVGSLDAKIFFVGEAPGAEEEIQGEPFVGPAGELLTRMIRAMGLERDQVYIGNIMNWRPEMPSSVGNRPPTPEEMAYCLPFLRAQVAVVQPQLLVALGGTAALGLLGPERGQPIGRIRGRWHSFNDLPVMVTYHPSYILRSGSNRSKRMVWEDLLKVMERAGLPISERQRSYFL